MTMLHWRYYILTLLTGLLVSFSARSQTYELSRQVIGSYALNDAGTSLSINATMGELAISDKQNANWMLTQGFWQTNPDELNFYSLWGTVHEGEGMLAEGKVFLYRTDFSDKYPPLKEVNVVDGMFNVVFIPPAEYLILATPADTSGDYLPTYFPNRTQRESAVPITINGYIGDVDIYLKSKVNSIKNGLAETELVDMYPNPVTDILKIKVNSPDIKNIRIINSLGTQLYFQDEFSKSEVLITNLSTGMYTVLISTAEGQVVRKIMVQ